jgi:hypothetical protein
MAEETGCTKTFSTMRNANRHADSIHRGMTYPYPMAKETGCTKTFRGEEAANHHAESIHRVYTVERRIHAETVKKNSSQWLV